MSCSEMPFTPLLQSRRNPSLEEVRALRHLLEKVLLALAVPRREQHAMLLCLSELGTNLVEHASPKASALTLTFGQDAQAWWLCLEDDGGPWQPGEFSPFAQTPETILSGAESGRGLALVGSLCDTVSYTPGAPNRLLLGWYHPARERRVHIALVEDDAALLRLYRAHLEPSYRVSAYRDPGEALAALAESPVELVISDIQMPRMDGFALRAALLERCGDALIPFVFLSAHDSEATLRRAAALGIDDYLVKPITRERLLHCVERVLGRTRQLKRLLSERIERRIARSLYPQLPEHLPGWRCVHDQRHPGSGGGDLLLYQSQPGRTLLILADVMGHDESAKFFAHAYGGYLRGLLHALGPEAGPAQLLAALAQAAYADQLLDAATLTCLVLALYPDGMLELAAAGHPKPLLLDGERLTYLPVEGVLPGLLPEPQYHPLRLHLGAGQRLALYTDGLFDAAIDSATRSTLAEGVEEALCHGRRAPLHAALRQVMECFDTLAGVPPLDDTLLLLLEPDTEPGA